MTAKDISNTAVLLDTLSKYLMDNLKVFRDKCPKLKENTLAFKTATKNNPLTFDI